MERSIEFVGVRQAGDDAVVAARFEDEAGRARRAMVGLLTVDGAWRGTGGFSNGVPAGVEHASWGAGYWSHSGGRRLVIGFWVVEPAAASLRVTDVAGRVLTDTVQNGVAVVVAADGDFNESRATRRSRRRPRRRPGVAGTHPLTGRRRRSPLVSRRPGSRTRRRPGQGRGRG